MAMSWSIVSLPQGTSLVSWDIRSAEKEVIQILTAYLLVSSADTLLKCLRNTCRIVEAGLYPSLNTSQWSKGELKLIKPRLNCALFWSFEL